MIYLDNAATTFPKPDSVYKEMDNANRNYAINAGRGSYKLARDVSALISDTKNKLRELVNDDKESSVVFAPSITIALNQIINGLNIQNGATIYVSPYEHNAVARTVNHIAQKVNVEVIQLPLNKETLEIDMDKVRYQFSIKKPDYIFSTHVSNVTGYILPVEEIFSEGKKYNCVTVLDSAQSLGLVEVDSKKLFADIIAFAGHKTLYGPFGIGGFINVGNIELEEFIVGGTGTDSLNLNMPDDKEGKYESASKNIVAIAGLNAALKILAQRELYEKEKKLTDYLVNKLSDMENLVVLIPKTTEKHIGIVSFLVKGFNSNDIGEILDEDFNIAVRTGYHCAPYIHSYLKDEKYLGTVRVGLSQFNTKKDIDRLLVALEEL